MLKPMITNRTAPAVINPRALGRFTCAWQPRYFGVNGVGKFGPRRLFAAQHPASTYSLQQRSPAPAGGDQARGLTSAAWGRRENRRRASFQTGRRYHWCVRGLRHLRLDARYGIGIPASGGSTAGQRAWGRGAKTGAPNAEHDQRRSVPIKRADKANASTMSRG